MMLQCSMAQPAVEKRKVIGRVLLDLKVIVFNGCRIIFFVIVGNPEIAVYSGQIRSKALGLFKVLDGKIILFLLHVDYTTVFMGLGIGGIGVNQL